MPTQTSTEAYLDIEFENAWETTSDWNEDDDDAVLQEIELCFPPIRNTMDDETMGYDDMNEYPGMRDPYHNNSMIMDVS